ncbi:PP2C family protein-serine/threonine phosphatase [Streptomyces sulfonofaciens]|uniref:PP2C family protein-serine/threonine phosphatase n=1 Tax=Streptomyces sulfonofaciens TaxID=68272 RepID=UPI0027E46871|nr:PP2C family protein-serine/threonine phosphatase [Streptomyces sulfonofaciens]
MLIPIVLIAVITVVDIRTPDTVHLGPALVIAPALTPSFAGPRRVAFIGVLATVAQVVIAQWHGGLTTTNHLVQIPTIAVLSALIWSFSVVRQRRSRQLAQVRSVAEAAQQVLLWPLPERLGPLRVASLYLAAEDEAQIGGDLYAATRTEHGTRVMIGDVRGKGLPAVGEAALVLGAFREAAHEQSTLPRLARALDRSVTRYLADFEPTEEAGERFATVLLLEIPDDRPVTRLTSCGHPPPLLLSRGRPVSVPDVDPSPPLGVGGAGDAGSQLDLSFEPGDTLLLYTDGVVEARDGDGAFYPFAERAAQWTDDPPEALLHRVRRDLLGHAGGRLADDAALVALCRAPVPSRGPPPGPGRPRHPR